jgi:hypothetical protein
MSTHNITAHIITHIDRGLLGRSTHTQHHAHTQQAGGGGEAAHTHTHTGQQQAGWGAERKFSLCCGVKKQPRGTATILGLRF